MAKSCNSPEIIIIIIRIRVAIIFKLIRINHKQMSVSVG